MTRRFVLYAALACTGAGFGGAEDLSAQPPDSIRADSTQARYVLEGLTIGVTRATTTTGGASAVRLRLDSAAPMPAATMEQVFRAMPLLVIRQNSRGEAQPALRGTEERQIAVLMDGVPLTLGWDHRTDLSIIPLTAAQGITLIRGLSSVLHGPNVLGGVIEVDVASGPDRQSDPDPMIVNMAVDHVGGRAMSVTGGELVTTDAGEWVFRGGTGYQQRAGVVLPGGLEDDPGQNPALLTSNGDLRLNSDSERYDGFLSARYRSDGGAWFSSAASAVTTERGVPPESHVDDPRLWRYPESKRLIAAISGGTGLQSTGWGEGDLEASVGVDLAQTRIDQFSSALFNEKVGEEIGDDQTLTFRLLGDHTLGERSDLRTALTFADVAHDELLDGVESSEFEQRLWSLGTEVERQFDSFFGIPNLVGTRVTAGFALDGSDTPKSGDKPPLGTLWDWGARIGFSSVVQDSKVRLHGGMSRRTRFPALRELYSGALGRFEPNPELDPEILTGGELGLTWNGRQSELQVVGFHQRLSDGIVRTSVQVDGVSKFKRVNRDQIRGTGLELLGSTQMGWLALGGDVTLQTVAAFEADGTEVELEYEPTVVGKVRVGAPLPLGLVGSGDLRFISEQRCENPESGGLEAFSTSPNVDFSLSRRFVTRSGGALTRLEASVGVDNAGNAAVFDQCGLPQPGRTFRVQLRLW